MLSWLVLSHTRFGLRLRAVGDDEAVARTRGIPPTRFRVVAAVIAGGFAGLAGATVPLAEIGTFSPGMTGGTGFIALAVVIIGRRTPVGLIAGALLFSFFNSLALLAQTQSLGLPVKEEIYFPDHHFLSAGDLAGIRRALRSLGDAALLVTEKDWARWREDLAGLPVYGLRVRFAFRGDGQAQVEEFLEELRCST